MEGHFENDDHNGSKTASGISCQSTFRTSFVPAFQQEKKIFLCSGKLSQAQKTGCLKLLARYVAMD